MSKLIGLGHASIETKDLSVTTFTPDPSTDTSNPYKTGCKDVNHQSRANIYLIGKVSGQVDLPSLDCTG